VEWRRFGAPGDASDRTAHRQLPRLDTPEPWTLYAAAEEDRLLRLRRPRGAPETFFVPAVPPESVESSMVPWILRPRWPAAGGEVFGFVEVEDFRPATLRLDDGGAVKELIPDAWGQFAASGLRPGRFRLRAVFQGGWKLDGPSIRVEEGETAELLPWALPRNGAVELEIEPGLCADLDGSRTVVFESNRRRGGARRLELETGACAQRIEGLPPGEWTISIDDPGPQPRQGTVPGAMRRAQPRKPPVSATVAIEAGEVSTATLERPGIFLEGRVTASGQGLPDLELRLTHPPSTGTASEPEDEALVGEVASTDSEGTYRIQAAAPGPAVLRLYSEDGFPVISTDVELSVGTQRHDFDLGEGRIRVLISSADGEPEGPVTLEVWQAGTRRLLRTGPLEPDQEETLVYGLELGHYELSAFTEQGLATPERPQVELTKSRPSDDVELVLEKQRAVATVLDASGRPVPGLLVAIDQRQLAETGEHPGEYSLLGASAGSELRVVPPLGYLPVCRMLERIEPVDVTLRPAGAHALLIPPAGPLPPAGTFLGALENLPGSNCAMPVSLLWQPVEDATGRQLVRLDGLTQGTFLFRNMDGVVLVQVPGPPVPMPGVE
ncbi:MAG: carboxypeptidase-like regulatory domain-containing protein, partial [Acidobacteriota bacterium]